MGTKVILVLVGIGLIMGLALISSELVNPFTGMSRYERAHAETLRIARLDDIELKRIEDNPGQIEAHQQQLDAMELRQVTDEIRHRREMNAIRVQMLEDQFKHQQLLQEKEFERIQAWADFEKGLLDTAGAVLPWALALAAIILSIGLSYRIASMPMATPEPSRVLLGILALALVLAGSGTVVLLLNYLAA